MRSRSTGPSWRPWRTRPSRWPSIHTLVQLGRTLGIETLAEGIEEQWQLQRLQSEHCERGQGFLFSRPVDPAAIEALLTSTLSASEVSSGAADPR